ncbi:efflux RND transporter periplasmic adaptor subunit [Lichenihabitans sp. Uapishka_5]|uniref:efflux RND transporter periplasmic adaptor subunit n=1 Tax=Lichenihabitans sp. Uapishka_5 TaxID=3037302 RepID=UPI0029E81C95|nr:efflux RND transporter periplasmic adaptor subunit [Lichenihabitans sp. Uapishka_5]MDX7953018.1 efflux RND transporter periplasmic adaptor subunit [Lichenihabitans sp. Uapishka_5]
MIRATSPLLPACALMAALGFATVARAAEPAATNAEASPPAVTVVPVADRELVLEAVITGTLVPRDEVLVSPELDGNLVTDVLVEEGDRVEKGQVLARLAHDMLDTQVAQQAAAVAKAQAAVVQAQNSITQAQADQTQGRLALDRARSLVASGSTTAAALDGAVATAQSSQGRLGFAQSGLVAAQADLDHDRALASELAVKLGKTAIRAPVDGVVSRRAARVGIRSSNSQELFRLIGHGTIELEGDVIETRMPELMAGDPALVSIGDGAPVPGRVRVVYPEVDKLTRLGKLRITLGDDPRLHIGAFARGTVEVRRERGLAVPVAAVLYGDAGPSVLVVKADNRVEARPITTGLVDRDWVAVTRGLDVGERIVARAGSFLQSGDIITPVAPDPALQAAAR